MKLINFLIYFLTLSFFFLIFTILFDLIKNKKIFKKKEKSKGAPYEGDTSLTYNFNIKIDIKFLKVVILSLLLNTSIIYLLPWAHELERMGLFGLAYGLIFLFILLFAYLYILREKGIE